MKKGLLVIFFLFTAGLLCAQHPQMNSDMAYLYKIDQTEFKLYNSNYLAQQISAITANKPIDTIPYKDISSFQYSFHQIGTFVLVYAEHTSVVYQLMVNFPWRAETAFYPLKGGILVVDSLNKPIPGLDIRTDNDRIYYNAKSQIYIYEDPTFKGNIYISNGRMTQELKLDIPYKGRYGGGHGGGKYKKKKFKGFIAMNKPIYKPGDTLKVKAYICKNNGKPYTDSVDLRISEYYWTPLHTVKLAPVSPGAYLYEYIITDSLKIDKNYYVDIVVQDDKFVDIRNSFKLEDYKLDEAEYSLAPLHYTNYLEDSLYLQFEAYDKNHNQMFDAEVDIICKAYNIADLKVPSIYFPDTLLMATYRLADLTGGIIQLPSYLKNKYPANYGLVIEANCRNSNNELKSLITHMEIVHEPTPFQYYISNYYLKISKNSTISDSLTVKKHTGFSEQVEEFKLHKNDSLKIDRNATAYSVEYDGDIRTFQVNANMFNVNLEGEMHRDSLWISITNPTGITMDVYYLQGGAKTSLLDTSFQILRLQKNKSVKIYCEYLTAGSKVVIGRSFILNDKNIWIKHNLPDKVYPGQSLDLNFTASDYKDLPQANTNLTVLTINSAFTENNIPSVPDFGKSADYASTSIPGRLEPKTLSTVSKTIDSTWYNKFNLQNNKYYQILFSPEKVIVYREPNIYMDDALVKIVGLNKYMNFINPAYVMENDSVIYYNASETDHIRTGNGKHTYKIRFDKFYYTPREIHTYKDSITYVIVKTDLLGTGKYIHKEKINLKPKEENLKIGQQYIVLKPYYNYYTYNNYYPYFIYNSKESYALEGEVDYNYYSWGEKKIIGPFKANPTDGIYVQQYKYNNTEYLIKKLERHKINSLGSDGFRINSSDFGSYKFPVASTYIYEPFNLKNPGLLYQNFDDWKNRHYDKFNYFVNDYTGDKTVKDKVMILFPETDMGIKGTILKNITKDSTYYLRGMSTLFYNLSPGAYRVIYVNKEMQPLVEDIFMVKENTFLVKEIDTVGIFFTDTLKSTLGQSRELKGRITDEKTGDAIMFASITIEQDGKSVGGFTSDLNGYFSLEIPVTNGSESIKIKCVGYEQKIIGYASFANEYSYIEFKLRPSSVDDVNIILGGIPAKYGDEKERVVQRRLYSWGMKKKFRTTNYPYFTGTDELYLNEIIVDVNTDAVFSSNRESDQPNDGIFDFDKTGDNHTIYNLDQNLDPEIIYNANAIRTFFADNAIWQPNLITGKNGIVSCKVRFPENITAWSTYILAISPKGLSGQVTTTTKSFKPVVASLYLPDFIIEGDSFEIVNKVMNYTGISVGTNNKLQMGKVDLMKVDTTIKDFFILKKMLFAGTNDSIKLSFSTSLSNGYMDGEKRVIPVYKKGIEVYEGKMFATWKNTTIQIDSLGPNNEIEIEVYNGFEDLITKEADYLIFQYKHTCNEQISSKLITAICASATTTKKWKKEIYDLQIERMIQLLRKNQNENGGWSWWNKGETNVFMTLKVAEGLKLAEEKGYQVNLKNQIARVIPHLLEKSKDRNDTLAVMKIAGLYKVPKEKVFDVKTIQIPTLPNNDYQKLLIMEIDQLYGHPIDISALMAMKKETLYGNYYWGVNSYYLYDNATYMTSMALEILKREKVGQDTLVKLIRYMMEKRMNGHFANTMVSAKMSLFLHDYIGTLGKTDPMIIIDQKDTIKIKNIYQKLSIPSSTYSIEVKTDRLIYVGYSQQKALPFEAVKEENFSIKHEWLQDDKPVNEINAGKFVTLHTTVEVKKDAQYISFEIPIPAGCTYAEKLNPTNYYWNKSYEVHREYYKDRIVVYYENLPTGKYELNFKLEPRFKGTYTVNNSLIGNMYFPQLNGYNALYKMKIK